MAEELHLYRYLAMDPTGRRVRGEVEAHSDALAFERLRRDGYAPIQIKGAAGQGARRRGDRSRAKGALDDREAAELLADLAALLEAGADMRAALSILGGRAGRAGVARACKALSADISSGGALDRAFFANLPSKHGFVSALVAAGEASGDLAGALKRAAEMLEARIRLKDQLISVVSYPAFVALSTVAAIGGILLFVIPSLAPLVDTGDASPPLMLKALIATSELLRSHSGFFAGLGAAGLLGVVAAGRLGLLRPLIERLALDGPLHRTTAGVVYGAFAITLGTMLAAGAPMSEALKLSVRSVRSSIGRKRLEPVVHAVRQGLLLSAALDKIAGFPVSIARLSAVGEATGALGAMLVRAGRLEEEAALRRIERAGRMLGPILIVALGGVVGLLMAGLLTSISQLGENVAG